MELEWVDKVADLGEARTAAVHALLTAARDIDGKPEIEPGGPLPGEFDGGRMLLATAGDRVVGVAHVDVGGDSFGRKVAELVIHPDHRLTGLGGALGEALLAEYPRNLRLWAHGDQAGAATLAERFGLARARELLIMHVDVEGADWPEPTLPDGVTLRTFRPGVDEQALIDVNAKAFDWHPEQGALTVAELTATESESWFDPDGLFLAERDGTVIGFHWTKVHPPNPAKFGGKAAGEVYVVGVDPAAQGGGLGRALTLAGLRHLRERGLEQVILYVEGDNEPAVAVYRRLGFTPYEVDVQYGTADTV
ncbi:mycothiol synthase [Saccharomonospora sp. CUA-673]|uniref:mycothiol synthase n=1 Tax=Saccharomonospora sp. CUA-673 TaxID=1904969 RepID=UPI00096219A7|nr:mycothiol synthase [Saccharomonospora sp. CUA-673]OLT46352.1 mycothiol synthase [Saccharomonospora sp. CUA-673]